MVSESKSVVPVQYTLGGLGGGGEGGGSSYTIVQLALLYHTDIHRCREDVEVWGCN